jgi:predicted DNA-binding transcriptional regulator YafY
MGKRGRIETVVAILRAFLDQPTWKQAELARKLGVGPPALRKHLQEMQRAGFPFEAEDDHPHVYWSVPKGWLPGAVALTSEEAAEVLRELSRLPRAKARDKIIQAILYRLRATSDMGEPPVVAVQPSPEEEKHLPVVEDAANEKKVLSMRYYSSSRGHVSQRFASVQRVVIGPPARFIAHCHSSKTLRWFRVSNVEAASLARDQEFVDVPKAEVTDFQKTSLDGYHDTAPPTVEAFFVRDPEARWVKNNLLAGMTATQVEGGIRIEAETSALGRLARYVVSLGPAACPETISLAKAVADLAKGALDSIKRGPAHDAE